MKENIHHYLKLGINHHLLFSESIRNPKLHLETLPRLLKRRDFEVIDLFIPYDEKIRKEERKLILASKKEIVYNAHFLPSSPVWPCSPDPIGRAHALILAFEQIDVAYSIKAKKILLHSGPDPGKKYHRDAKKWFTEYCLRFAEYLAKKGRMIAVMEPMDREKAKKFFIGPTSEAVKIIENVRHHFKNLYLQLDMAHLLIAGESFNHALHCGGHLLRHLHLGNCVISNPSSLFYGDMHPPLGIEDGEADVDELSEFLRIAFKVGFLNKKKRPSVTIEIQPYPDCSAEETLEITKEKLALAWEKV